MAEEKKLTKGEEMIQKAEDAASRLEEANKKAEEINSELKARDDLGGKSDGAEQEEEPKELSDEEYAQKALRNEL